jgi:hypothetical protein
VKIRVKGRQVVWYMLAAIAAVCRAGEPAAVTEPSPLIP